MEASEKADVSGRSCAFLPGSCDTGVITSEASSVRTMNDKLYDCVLIREKATNRAEELLK